MIDEFESILGALTQPTERDTEIPLFDPLTHFDDDPKSDKDIARALNAAFLIMLVGNKHPQFDQAKSVIERFLESPYWKTVARFYLRGIQQIHDELSLISGRDPELAERIRDLRQRLSADSFQDPDETIERIWSVFFPEAVGIRANKQSRVMSLRQKRKIKVTKLNNEPVHDPARQVLFTSNALLTLPIASQSLDSLGEELRQRLNQCAQEPQLHWYDHPIPIGIPASQNEALYGLQGLNQSLEHERIRGNMSHDAKVTCILSVSVTHNGLKEIAKHYLQREFNQAEPLKNLEVFVFTEADTERLVRMTLVPAARRLLQRDDAEQTLSMFGVDGAYGKHYSFLKAIAAFWGVFVQPDLKATYKIDLDQVFPQNELITQTGASALEHLQSPLWGARGVDMAGQPVELGMIAGFVVNERDIDKSVFTPDVTFPDQPNSADELIFFSRLPQALSTEAEMMTRYTNDELDGQASCIQRFHVLGGMNGILVESLRRHRPFTPTFVGRAEDQAYLLSMFPNTTERLAGVHKDGLAMRHDKEAFAREAIESARVGQMLGDYIRILYYSAYARVLSDNDEKRLKEVVDPFTGCFISRLPSTVVLLRFALKAASLFNNDQDQGLEFVVTGAERLNSTFDFIQGEDSLLRQTYEQERRGWDLYYDTLDAIEKALERKDPIALELAETARKIVADCAIQT